MLGLQKENLLLINSTLSSKIVLRLKNHILFKAEQYVIFYMTKVIMQFIFTKFGYSHRSSDGSFHEN